MSEWIEWSGGECPVAPETVVEIRVRDGNPYPTDTADKFYWLHGQLGSDIIAYRVVSTPEEEVAPLGDEPAFPASHYETEHGDRVYCTAGQGGLSQRAYIATAAMQGLIAGGMNITAEDTANDAVNYADALLAALRKE